MFFMRKGICVDVTRRRRRGNERILEQTVGGTRTGRPSVENASSRDKVLSEVLHIRNDSNVIVVTSLPKSKTSSFR